MRRLTVLSLVIFSMLTLATSASTATQKYEGPAIAAKARYVALHGGVTGSCWGCATPQMKSLVIQVIRARWAGDRGGTQGLVTSICTTWRESGFNPGAISSTGDWSQSQFNYVAHHWQHPDWWQPGRGFKYLIQDPWKSSSEMLAMSQSGTNFTAWRGGLTSCPFAGH